MIKAKSDWAMTPAEKDNEYAVQFIYAVCEHYWCCNPLQQYANRFPDYESDYVMDKYQHASEQTDKMAEKNARAFDSWRVDSCSCDTPFSKILEFALDHLRKHEAKHD